MKGHASEAELNDRIDDTLAPRRREELERHLAQCTACAGRYTVALEIVNRIRALPRQAHVPRPVARPAPTALGLSMRQDVPDVLLGRAPALQRAGRGT